MLYSDEALPLFRTALEEAPLGVLRHAEQAYSMIPAAVEPLILPDRLWKNVQHDAGHILSALEKTGAWLSRDRQCKLFKGLAPLEKEPADYGGLATARLDLFFDGDDLLVIEANTTIPAMQAYSDMIKAAFYKAFRPDQTPAYATNTQELLQSLLQHYERTGGKKKRPLIAIVARAGDSQMAELLWLQNKWQQQNYETLLVTPDLLQIKDGQLWTSSRPIDLTYRHIFAHRLSRTSALAEACLKSESYRVFNPIAAHLEAKGVLAELSRMAADPVLSRTLQLNEDEIQATRRRVVWSRLLKQEATSAADGSSISDLISWVKEHQEDLVIKSSLGYGGQGIYIGSSFAEQPVQARAQNILGRTQAISWEEFVDFLGQTGEDQWIVQKKVTGRKIRNRFLKDGRLMEEDTYIDCSIFTSSGTSMRPSGGACRFSTDAIVNIGQGGGLVPLLLESEMQQI